ncbi:hypothetical protein F5Y19DRAFT_474237 [Xylariaceae sp. FL1651]|nr:hypothetical protein F5Y19DRAFT_474237 [Xylariaceae sp. FL1651]
MTGHIVTHLVRRGVQHLAARATAEEQYVNQLEKDAQLYENAGPEMEVKPREVLPVLITGLLALLIISLIDYTIGQVVSALAMIESPSRTAIVESKPAAPLYTDEPDAPLEKMPVEINADVEVTVIQRKPITSNLRRTVGHLHRIGGFSAHWRGLGLAVFYHLLHASAAHFFVNNFGLGVVGEAFVYIFVSYGLARLHLVWTHTMIAYPSSKSWYRRIPAYKDCGAILLPTVVYAAAQQATILLPVAVALAVGVTGPQAGHASNIAKPESCLEAILLGLRLLAVLLTYITVSLAVLLPASITLTRIEAICLPEGEEAIVLFDKEAIMGDINLDDKGSYRALFVHTWKAVDSASKWRLVKLYAKMMIIHASLAFVGLLLMGAELYLIGHERLGIFFKSARAQLLLAGIEASKQQ